DELVMSWPGAVKAYNPANGDMLWSCSGLEKDSRSDSLVYTSPLVGPDVVICMGGYHGPALAVRPGGKGGVTETRRLWRRGGGPEGGGRGRGAGVLLGPQV